MKKASQLVKKILCAKNSLAILLLAITTLSFAQIKSTIAVVNPNVVQLRTTPTIAAKLLRLELIKMDNYFVYDEFDMEDIYKVDSTYRFNCLSKSCLVKMELLHLNGQFS